METLAYLHLAYVYEADKTTELRFDFSHWNWQRLQGQIGLRLLAIVVPITILALAGQAMAASVLQVGDSGPDVTNLQQQLKVANYFNQAPTGYYGSITKEAVQRFQNDHRLTTDGIAGPETLQALSSYLNRNNKGFEKQASFNSDSELRIGSSGPMVKDLQWKLKQVGHQITVDGQFGSETDRAVRAFQKDKSLPEDGVVDAATMNTLNWVVSTNEPPIPYACTTQVAQKGKQFVVVVPMNHGASIAQVFQFEPCARVMPSRLGKFIQAGSFPDRATAETRARRLRGEGLDAQVRYF